MGDENPEFLSGNQAPKSHEEQCITCRLWRAEQEIELPSSLKRVVHLFLEKQLRLSALFAWLELAERYHFHELFQFIEGLICQHFVDFSFTEQFLALGEVRLRWVVRNEKIVCSEACLLEALVRWYERDVLNRKESFRELSSFIKLELISNKYLKAIIKKYNLGKVLPELKAVAEKEKRTKLALSFTREREFERSAKYSNVAVVGYMWQVGGSGACESKQNFFVKCWLPLMEKEATLAFRKGTLHHCPHMRHRERLSWRDRDNFTNPVVINNKVYVLHRGVCKPCQQVAADQPTCDKCCRTSDNKDFHFHLSCYDLCDGSYKVQTTLESNRYCCSALSLVRVGFYLFVAEHTFDGHVLFHRYNTESSCDKWESFSLSKSHSLETPCVVPCGIEFIYVIWFRSIERYNIFTQSWESLSQIPECAPIAGIKVCLLRQQIEAVASVVGLVESVSTRLTYLPATDKWEYSKTSCECELIKELHSSVQVLSLYDCDFAFAYLSTSHSVDYVPVLYRITKKHYKKKLLHTNQNFAFATQTIQTLYDSSTFVVLSREAMSRVIQRAKLVE